jgi:ATP-binding cassette, sub-family E, member 1
MSNRIAIVDQNRCKPEKCKKECISNCPPQTGGKEVIQIIDIEDISSNPHKDLKCKKKIANIVEKQCIGCNICVKKCPFNAIRIVNLPFENKFDIIHRYTPNGFRLYKLPQLKKNMVMGIIGENGIGKSTLINILSNQLIPNFELFDQEFTIKQILSKFRGSVIYDYLKSLYSSQLKIAIKPQRFSVPSSTVNEFLKDHKKDDQLLTRLELTHLLETNMKDLSGGELQRLLCYITLSTEADVYFFDEPSNYLDIKQRLEITKLIRELIHPDKYVIVIDHDMSMVDFMADEILILYGKPSAYGIVSLPMTTLEGINVYMDGYIPSENVRFRPDEFNLKPSIELVDQDHKDDEKGYIHYKADSIEYPTSKFKMIIPSDKINMNGSIHVIMGENGNGKSTFLKYIAKTLDVPISHKNQTLSIKKYCKDGIYPTVNELFYIHLAYTDARFIKEIVRPLDISDITDRHLDKLSGGELQRVLLILCLGTPAMIYMIDEPSANLDIEKRMTVIKVIKRFILNNNKCALIIEHDMMMAVAFSQEFTSRILTIHKEIKDDQRICTVSPYMTFNDGITSFLKSLDITMRISNHNRPRINKLDSQLDKEQKLTNSYYV